VQNITTFWGSWEDKSPRPPTGALPVDFSEGLGLLSLMSPPSPVLDPPLQQLMLRDHGYGASASHGVPVYAPSLFLATKGSQIELTWVDGYIRISFACLKTVTNPSTNQA